MMTFSVEYEDNQPGSDPARGVLPILAASDDEDARGWAEQILNGTGKGRYARIIGVHADISSSD
jgi:hypothetical protein